ncbi:flavin-containing monooxygenase [Aspergillus ruber CBS 135680]|uniref:Flavin-binding monooxygenase-like protein n=1 Tax=Aspergillus ruber (strain CBS 135680) TaxID=1388766 RepID=A0A017SKR6_ASPRC|nr:flavin-binding monooxygenase-like protein [Aspergillus ruber CBS 135680]EYE97229.1 flavin-binding monooxygenase-like protein [Aspergillus ruber CBS 135680]
MSSPQGQWSLSALIKYPFLEIFSFAYVVFQTVLNWVFAPVPPPPTSPATSLPKKRVAVIGAGLTGVSSAAHCVGHGFDVQLFESRSKDKGLGGIWSRVNSTSSLQIHSLMYRFHPSVRYDTAYPTQQEIRDQIVGVWKRYGLQKRTVFDTKVTSVKQGKDGKWIINDNEKEYGRFDGILATVGVCGDPKMPTLPDQSKFKGGLYHSSDLDGKHVKGKKVLVVGGGASAIEALEFAAKSGAREIDVLSRSDKWVIPRNFFVQSLLAMNIFGQETTLSWVPEWLLHKLFYRDMQDIAPSGGLFTQTPMANSELFDLIRDGHARWIRGDIVQVQEDGILFNHRTQGVPKGGPGRESVVTGDVIILATGFKRPSLSFLPDEVFEEPYGPPSWYLQVFPPKYTSICANNSTYVDAIGTVGNMHIGIYTRFLLMFLVDPLSQPTEGRMKTWIDWTRLMKRFSPTGAFDFFTYSELIYWFLFVILVNPFRWKWAPFVLFGVGRALPMEVVKREEALRKTLRKQR